MAKNASLFSPLSGSLEHKDYVVYGYALMVFRSDDIEWRNGWISKLDIGFSTYIE